MHLIVVIGFITFGLAFIALGLCHEVTWLRRRAWRRESGVVIGFTEEWNDGVSYFPEIQYEGPHGPSRFVSKYGSSTKPHLGDTVDLVVDQSGGSAERITATNRLLFTLVPIIFGVIFVLLGLSFKPLAEGERRDVGSSTPTQASP